jgi:putative flippase GtrA
MTVYLVSLALSNLTLMIPVRGLRLAPETANVFAILQSTATNYLGCRGIVFRQAGRGA